MCNFNLKDYIQKNITKIGIIFNTDTHDKPGKHWISLFIDLDKKFIFYFDSNGTKMPKQIKVFINRVEQQAQHENIIVKVDSNEGFTHQYNDGQCGMYALYFIIELLKENPDKIDWDCLLRNPNPEAFDQHNLQMCRLRRQ